ncbi:FKBP-type peptidyl-prolyl cis-trans isomerase [Sphingomonas sp. LR60]|uniref:FKBP-type peptidyl-prolyl cis-trans isomerase n=1 Tax=Sphingomonas sp. LR60 TaxID=3050233 RepID=UPI002FE3E242
MNGVAPAARLAYSDGMSFRSRRASRLFLAAILPVLAAPTLAGAATSPQKKPQAAATTSVRTDNAIIPLPLNPVVPAGQRLCSTTAATGLGSTMLRAGTGAKPTAGDVVLVNYIGYLGQTGVVFDQGMRSPLPVDGVIPGFSQGLQTMARGGISRFCIPAALGYGAQASGPIPANADLVFQVELLDFKTAAEVESMNRTQAGDTTPRQDMPPQP